MCNLSYSKHEETILNTTNQTLAGESTTCDIELQLVSFLSIDFVIWCSTLIFVKNCFYHSPYYCVSYGVFQISVSLQGRKCVANIINLKN